MSRSTGRSSSISQVTWDGLLARNPWATPFSSWAFQRAWWDAYGANAHDETVVVLPADSSGAAAGRRPSRSGSCP